MRAVVGMMAGLLVATAWAADPVTSPVKSAERRPSMQIWARIMEASARAQALQPRRRDAPLRYANMTDEEVREVQVIAREYKMSEFVNISPVVTGCPCEEGGACTEQVYITSTLGEGIQGLQLSRHKNAWTVGVVQKWWLEYEDLLARKDSMTYLEFLEARELKLLELPTYQNHPPTTVAENSPKQ